MSKLVYYFCKGCNYTWSDYWKIEYGCLDEECPHCEKDCTPLDSKKEFLKTVKIYRKGLDKKKVLSKKEIKEQYIPVLLEVYGFKSQPNSREELMDLASEQVIKGIRLNNTYLFKLRNIDNKKVPLFELVVILHGKISTHKTFTGSLNKGFIEHGNSFFENKPLHKTWVKIVSNLLE